MLTALFALIPLCAASAVTILKPLLAEENIEHIIHLNPRQPNRLQFTFKKHGPLWIAITPCGGTVHWQLFHNPIYEKLKIGTKSKLLAGEADEKRMIYFAKRIDKGLLTMVLTSSAQTSARVFFTTQKRELDWQYPAKPYDATIKATILPSLEENEDTATAEVQWNIPLEIEAMSEVNKDSKTSKRYRFCVTVSRKQPEWTVCDELGENLESIHCVHKLHDAKLRSGNLIGRQGFTQNYHFNVHRAAGEQRKILITLYSCNGYIRLAINRKGVQIYRSNSFTGYHRFLVTDITLGHIKIEIINVDDKPKHYRIWASTAPHKVPYPQLPEDTSIKTMKRTCSSITLQWMKSHNSKVKYCLYKRKEEAKYIQELISKNNNYCHRIVPGSELAACHTVYTKPEAFVLTPQLSSAKSYDYEGDLYNPIFETTVTGLEPRTTYRFDLLAQPLHKPHTQHLPYRTIWARTLNC